MDPEDIEAALRRFEQVLDLRQTNMPAFVIIEGGTWAERSDIANRFEEAVPDYCDVADINLYEELADCTISDDLESLEVVTSVIHRCISPESGAVRPAVVFLWPYELLLALDDRLRRLYANYDGVRAWVLLPHKTKRWLSESSPSQRGGDFRGYLRDETLGPVIVARPPGSWERRYSSKRTTKRGVTGVTTSTYPAVTEEQIGPTRAQIDAALRAREGQAKFREDLLRGFQNRCAVTGSTVTALLEAAHIEPYSEGQNHRLSNGLILRADIHTLFDKGLLAIKPLEACKAQVVIHRYLQHDLHYKHLHLIFIALPDGECESRQTALLRHYDQFRTRGA